MRQSQVEDRKNRKEEGEDMVLHFVNGNLRLDGRTNVSSHVQLYKAAIYADEYIGEIVDSDVVIGYNDNQQIWVEVENADGNCFSWGNWDTDRKVMVLFYVLTEDGEYLLYGSNKDFFCYFTIPQVDPRQDRVTRIPNMHLNTTYQVLCELLKQTKEHEFKVIPRWFEG